MPLYNHLYGRMLRKMMYSATLLLMILGLYKLTQKVDNKGMFSFVKSTISAIIASIIMVPAREYVMVRERRR
jgi:hypothetical protein